jgi:rhamnosyltransferase
LSDKIVAVTGRQIPRAHCVPLLKYDIDAVFAHLGPVVGTTLFYADSFIRDQPTHDLVRFYSDVNSAARRSVLLDDVPYRDVSYAEDLQFGEDVVHRGYVKAYAPRGSVIHSNDLRLSEFRKRQFDEVFNVRANGTSISVPSRRRVARAILAGSVRDSSRILRDPEYSLAEKLRWLGVNPLFHVEKWRGIRSALTTAADDAASHARWSLDAMRRT